MQPQHVEFHLKIVTNIWQIVCRVLFLDFLFRLVLLCRIHYEQLKYRCLHGSFRFQFNNFRNKENFNLFSY